MCYVSGVCFSWPFNVEVSAADDGFGSCEVVSWWPDDSVGVEAANFNKEEDETST